MTVAGRPADNAAGLVAADEPVVVAAHPTRYVSRGGEKLAAALERFAIDPAGRECLDAGASTGGFTDCLLQRGASRVASVDVGYGQLAWRLRSDPRVVVVDRTNVRNLVPGDLPFAPGLVAVDLSFISLRLVVAPLLRLVAEGADFLLLVKPQFEVRPHEVERGGVVRDPEAWRRAVEGVALTCEEYGVAPLRVMASPLLGPAGNVEFLVYAAEGGEPVAIDSDAAIREALAIRESPREAPARRDARPGGAGP